MDDDDDNGVAQPRAIAFQVKTRIEGKKIQANKQKKSIKNTRIILNAQKEKELFLPQYRSEMTKTTVKTYTKKTFN